MFDGVLPEKLDRTRRENDHRDAKFTVLGESVRHYIRELENEMLPKAKELDIDFEAAEQRKGPGARKAPAKVSAGHERKSSSPANH